MGDQPFAELPEEITFTREEVAVLMFGLDVLEEAQVAPGDAAKVRKAIRLLTGKLWPDLGDLLDGDDPQ